MRAHAHLDTRRREPYLFEQNEILIIRDAIRMRYTYLPLWYNVFHEASTTGVPVMRYVLLSSFFCLFIYLTAFASIQPFDFDAVLFGLSSPTTPRCLTHKSRTWLVPTCLLLLRCALVSPRSMCTSLARTRGMMWRHTQPISPALRKRSLSPSRRFLSSSVCI